MLSKIDMLKKCPEGSFSLRNPPVFLANNLSGSFSILFGDVSAATIVAPPAITVQRRYSCRPSGMSLHHLLFLLPLFLLLDFSSDVYATAAIVPSSGITAWRTSIVASFCSWR
jgi:hypothetical protein